VTISHSSTSCISSPSQVGLGLYDVSAVVGGVTGAFQQILTLYRGPGFVASCAYEPHQSDWSSNQNCITISVASWAIGTEPTLYLKFEHDVSTGFLWEGFYRLSPLNDWVTFGRPLTLDRAINGTTLATANLRAGLFVMQEVCGRE
jgi:hypothetical protein